MASEPFRSADQTRLPLLPIGRGVFSVTRGSVARRLIGRFPSVRAGRREDWREKGGREAGVFGSRAPKSTAKGGKARVARQKTCARAVAVEGRGEGWRGSWDWEGACLREARAARGRAPRVSSARVQNSLAVPERGGGE